MWLILAVRSPPQSTVAVYRDHTVECTVITVLTACGDVIQYREGIFGIWWWLQADATLFSVAFRAGIACHCLLLVITAHPWLFFVVRSILLQSLQRLQNLQKFPPSSISPQLPTAHMTSKKYRNKSTFSPLSCHSSPLLIITLPHGQGILRTPRTDCVICETSR